LAAQRSPSAGALVSTLARLQMSPILCSSFRARSLPRSLPVCRVLSLRASSKVCIFFSCCLVAERKKQGARAIAATDVNVTEIDVRSFASLVLGRVAQETVVRASNIFFSVASQLELCQLCDACSSQLAAVLEFSSGQMTNVLLTGAVRAPTLFARAVGQDMTFVNGLSNQGSVAQSGQSFVALPFVCPAGSHLTALSCFGASGLLCVPCPNGTFSGSVNSFSCSLCSPNLTAFPPGQASCYPCPCGFRFTSAATPCTFVGPCFPCNKSFFCSLSLFEKKKIRLMQLSFCLQTRVAPI